MDKKIKKIVVVGGGSAGWITAGVLAADHCNNSKDSVEIVLIESPNVDTIGVGEGTWPSMRNTLRKIGISELEFIVKCNASFKQGSKFIGWRNGQDDDFYYHPFMVPDGFTQTDLHAGWQAKASKASYADTVNVQSHICQVGLAPKQPATPNYAGVCNYGYHLDAGKFASLLQQHCTTKLQVKHVVDHVEKVIPVTGNGANQGDIAAISCKMSGEISGDLFIDCTGSASLLLGKHYNIPFIDKKDILFNDSALAVQLPYPNSNSPIASATLSTAQPAGWIWDIGLSSRRGVGHTYSSTHMDDDKAEQLLRDYIKASHGEEVSNKVEPRKLTFRPGHREKFWHKNCVAVGMSSGFLEPLEASALALIEWSAKMISEQLPVNRSHMTLTSERYNDKFLYRWARVIEFLKLHYVLSERNDSPYWLDNKLASTIPPRLQQLLQLWQHQPPSHYDFVQNDEVFSSASYQYVLYGMNFETAARKSSNNLSRFDLTDKFFADNQLKLQKCLAGLPTNRQLVNYLAEQLK